MQFRFLGWVLVLQCTHHNDVHDNRSYVRCWIYIGFSEHQWYGDRLAFALFLYQTLNFKFYITSGWPELSAFYKVTLLCRYPGDLEVSAWQTDRVLFGFLFLILYSGHNFYLLFLLFLLIILPCMVLGIAEQENRPETGYVTNWWIYN